MNLTARERIFVRTGVIFVPLLLIVLFVARPLLAARSMRDSTDRSPQEEFRIYKRNVFDLERLRKEQKAFEKKLPISVTAESDDEQLSSFVKQVEETVKKYEAKLNDFVPRRQRRAAGATAREAQRGYAMHFETDQPNLIHLLKAFQEFDKPLQITTIDIKNNDKEPGKLKVALEFHTYLFDGSKP